MNLHLCGEDLLSGVLLEQCEDTLQLRMETGSGTKPREGQTSSLFQDEAQQEFATWQRACL